MYWLLMDLNPDPSVICLALNKSDSK